MSSEEHSSRTSSAVEDTSAEHEAENQTHIPHGDPIEPHEHAHGESIHLPAPTAWPIVTALGFTLLVGGILTHYIISILGAFLTVLGCVQWFRDVLPAEAHEDVAVRVQEIAVASSRKSVSRISVSEEHRAHLPLHTFSVWAGVKGGIAGGIAMIIPALIYGEVAQGSIWYPVNLLGGAGVAGWTNPTTAELRHFHWAALGIAILIHAISCSLIGLLYGASMPLLPKHPILLSGIAAPLVWTGLLYATLPTINPELSAHINWWAFLVSQFTFGLVAGYVISRSDYVRTTQSMPFAMRAGFESPGLTGHHEKERD